MEAIFFKNSDQSVVCNKALHECSVFQDFYLGYASNY